MVCYRQHDLSMTTKLTRTKAMACCAEEIFVCGTSNRALIERVCRTSHARHVEESLCRNTDSEAERRLVRARVHADGQRALLARRRGLRRRVLQRLAQNRSARRYQWP
jgi:hypothetical protein